MSDMAVSSYDQLLAQVNSLKAENSHLKKELKENSCQLTKLETEASCMKDALTQIQTSMQEEEAAAAETAMATSLDHNSNNGFSPLTSPLSPNAVRTHKPHSPPNSQSSSGSLAPEMPGSPSPVRQLQENMARMQELERERILLLTEQDNEEKLKTWYFAQLQSLKQRIDQLPITENYSLQADMSRRQLEYEARQLREAMQQRLGAADDIGERHEARMQRLCLIEREMQRLQQRRERLEREAQENSGHGSSKDSHSSPLNEPNANDPLQRCSNSPKPGSSAHHTPETKPKDPKHLLSHLPNGMNPAALTGAVGSAESDSPYAHLSADGSVQQATGGIEGPGGVSPSIPPTMLHGTWPYVGGAMAIHQRHVIKSTVNATSSSSEQETSSVMSFSSSACSSGPGRRLQPGQLGAKVEMVYSLLSMLGTHDKDDMSRTLLAMSSSQDSCIAMRQSGCLPLLIQLLHGPDKDSLLGDTRGGKEARARAAAALHNIVHSHPEERCRKQEARVLRLLEQIRAYCDSLREADGEEGSKANAVDTNPGPAMAALMKLSFDEEHRSAICQLGGLHAIADLLQVDYESNGNTSDQYAITVRRYAGMALTNLTFGDAANKALLCSMKGCMQALVLQLASENEDLRQVAASVIRNLSWRADLASKKILREVGAVVGLMKCALEVKKESTLKSALSALWNLSAHFTENKADICAVEGALEFLVATLTYKSPSRTWAVVENGGGILRNISSHVATNEVYRQVLRDHNCMQVLLRHLKSSSLTIVSNACGTLWNLSARNKHDQDLLWELGAVSMLKNLVHSKHKMIAMGSSAALRNLMSARPDLLNATESHKEGQPTLHVRKQRALEAEIDKNLRETYVSMEKDCHAMQRRMPVRSQHRSPQSSADYSPVPQRIAIWNPQQSPTHELILSQHRERSQSPTSRQVNCRDAPHPRDQDPRKLSGRSPGLDGEHSRAEDSSQHHSGTGSLESTHKRHIGGSSRIAQVMQEVAMHAGIDMSSSSQEPHLYLDQQTQDNIEREAPSSVELPPDDRCEPSSHSNSSYNAFGFGGYNMNARRASNDSINSINSDIYPMGTHTKLPYAKQPMDHSHSMDGTLNNALDQHQRQHKAIFQRVNHEDLGANMDSTINFSLKYSDESLTPAPRPCPREENYQPKPSLECGHYKQGICGEKRVIESCPQQGDDNQPQPVVLCQECNTPHMQREGMAVGHTFVPPPETERIPGNYPSSYSNPPAVQRKLMPMKDPCSLDFGGNMEDEKPIDYSRHNLPHSGHLRSRFNEDDHEHYVSDQPTDFTQRYNTDLPESTTEGINFVQTSLTTGTTGNIFMNNNEKQEGPLGNMPDGSSSRDNSSEGQLDLLRSDSVDTSTSLSSTHTAISRANDDKKQRYCVEDTPVVFSRCSSLSSLDSNEADHHLDHQEEDGIHSKQDNEGHPKDSECDEQDGDQRRENQQEGTGNEPIESGLQTPASMNQIQDTPLIFSRCSSVSSLSSFEVQSICDDHSSCYSDSRRASEVVSPSDLPDSPSQTMPPSPRRGRKQVSAQTSSCDPETVGVLPECEENLVTYATEGTPADFSCATSLSGLTIDDEEKAIVTSNIQDEGDTMDLLDSKNEVKESEVESGDISEREQNMLDECINSAMPPKKSTLSSKPNKIRSHNAVNVHSVKSPQQNGKHVSFSQQVCSQEAPNSYATEDTPINFSTATSLSDLSIEDIDIQATKEGKLKVNNPLSSSEASLDGQNAATTKQSTVVPGAQGDEMKSESSSLINDAEDSMLEECINSAMPKAHLNKSRSSQLSKHRSAKGMSKLRSPKPSGLPRKRLPSAGVRHKSPSPIPEMGSEYQNATSSQERVQQWQNGFGGTTDSVRTFCTEGTPQQFSTATSLSGLSMDSHNQEDVLNGNVTAQVDKSEPSEMKRRQITSGSSHIDSPRQYAVEGTPMSFSRNDSLSSLSCDDDVDLSKEKMILKDKMQKHKADGATSVQNKQSTSTRSLSKLPQPSSRIAQLRRRSEKQTSVGGKPQNLRELQSRQMVSNTSSSYDSPQVFNLEGTPVSFSRNDSLSSLSCEEDADLHNDKRSLRESKESKPKVNTQSKEGRAQKRTEECSQREYLRFGQSGSKPIQVNNQDHNSERPNSTETPVKFAVEDTPVCFSRNSSLSSLSDHDQGETQHEEESPQPEPSHTSVFAVEDTPICFSRNSSLSSLSVESLDGETSIGEQALLDECISSAMPRSQGKKTKRRHHKASRTRETRETEEREKYESGSDNPTNDLEDNQFSPLSPSEDASNEFSEITEQCQDEDKPHRGPRITKPGEPGSRIQSETPEKGVRGGRKTYKSPISNTSRSVSVPKNIQPNKYQATRAGAQKGSQVNSAASKNSVTGVKGTTPNRSGNSTPVRSSTPVRTTTAQREASPKGSSSSKPPPINTDTFTKKKNLTPGSAATARSVTSQPKSTMPTGTATKSLANKQANSKSVAQGVATKASQLSKDANRTTPSTRSNLSQKNSPNSSRNTSPCSPTSRSPRGSISGPTSRSTAQTAKSSSLSPARSPMSSRTSSPSPHSTASTRKPLNGTPKNGAPGRGSGASTSPSPRSGLPSRSLSPRNSVTGTSQKSTSPRSSISGAGTRNASPRSNVSGLGSKNTSPRSSVSETSARSVSPRNSISGIQARSVSPRNKTLTKAPVKKTNNAPAPADKKTTGTGTKTNRPKSSNVYRLEVGSSRPTLVKQSTFTKESASLPEQTPENTMGVESEAEKVIEENDENEGSVENDVFTMDDQENDSEEEKEESEPLAPSSSWRRISVESDTQQSVLEKTQRPSGSPKTQSSGSASKTPPTSKKMALNLVKPGTKTVSSGNTPNTAKAAVKNSPALSQKCKREQLEAKPSWNSSVTAPKNWGRSSSPANSRPESPAISKNQSQSPSLNKTKSPSPGIQRVKSQERETDELSKRSPKTTSETTRDLCKELDIPVKNYGGNVTSPVSDSSDNSIWIKREESTRRTNIIIRQNSSSVSLQSQNSQSGSARSVKSSNSATMSSSSASARNANVTDKPSGQGAKPVTSGKQGKEKDSTEKKVEKKKFSFLKLKVKGKKPEAEETKTKSKGDKQLRDQKRKTSKAPAHTMSPESDVTSPENDLEALNLEHQLDQLDVWNSDDNIDNEIMPDEFIEWDSETDIFKEELPDEYLLESGSDVTSSLTSPDSPCKGAYQIEKGNRTDDSPSPEFKQFRLENRLNSFIRMDCSEKECDSDSTRSAPVVGEAKNCRSKSVSDAYPAYSSGDQSPPRPQRLRLPKKPFGINRSDSSPTAAIPVLVSPFNYSPSKRSQSEPHSPDMARRRFQSHHSYSFHESREHRQRFKQYKQQQQQAPQEEYVCNSEDSDLISPTLSSRVTTV
ncbi:adenomatous polyposis coli protein-like isoform X2 [Acanthaster planci]|nr:adenomatous polyposis coli protein-like isoform X2 [Acanthaster planci]